MEMDGDRKKMSAAATKILNADVLGDSRLSKVVEAFYHLSGGDKGFAQLLWNEFNALEAGSPGRQRILAMLGSWTARTDDNMPETDLDLVSDQDLDAEITRRMPNDGTVQEEGLEANGGQRPAAGEEAAQPRPGA